MGSSCSDKARSAPHYLAAIELGVRTVRPSDRRDGAQMISDAMAVVGNDACQRNNPVPGKDGYVLDTRSERTLRLLLRALYPRAVAS